MLKEKMLSGILGQITQSGNNSKNAICGMQSQWLAEGGGYMINSQCFAPHGRN